MSLLLDSLSDPLLKRSFVHDIFTQIASKYDLMNDLMTFGMHRVWKKNICQRLLQQLQSKKEINILDIATGTGDIIFSLANICRDNNAIINLYGIDNNASMLAKAEQKLRQFSCPNNINIVFKEIEADTLETLSIKFDGIIMSYALRNMPNYEEMIRVTSNIMAKNGQLIILDMSEAKGLWNWLSRFHRFSLIPVLGRLITNSDISYEYLVKSPQIYLKQEELLTLLKKYYKSAHYKNLFGGICSIHEANS